MVLGIERIILAVNQKWIIGDLVREGRSGENR